MDVRTGTGYRFYSRLLLQIAQLSWSFHVSLFNLIDSHHCLSSNETPWFFARKFITNLFDFLWMALTYCLKNFIISHIKFMTRVIKNFFLSYLWINGCIFYDQVYYILALQQKSLENHLACPNWFQESPSIVFEATFCDIFSVPNFLIYKKMWVERHTQIC